MGLSRRDFLATGIGGLGAGTMAPWAAAQTATDVRLPQPRGAVVLCSLTTLLGYIALLGSHNRAIRSLPPSATRRGTSRTGSTVCVAEKTRSPRWKSLTTTRCSAILASLLGRSSGN